MSSVQEAALICRPPYMSAGKVSVEIVIMRVEEAGAWRNVASDVESVYARGFRASGAAVDDCPASVLRPGKCEWETG